MDPVPGDAGYSYSTYAGDWPGCRNPNGCDCDNNRKNPQCYRGGYRYNERLVGFDLVDIGKRH